MFFFCHLLKSFMLQVIFIFFLLKQKKIIMCQSHKILLLEYQCVSIWIYLFQLVSYFKSIVKEKEVIECIPLSSRINLEVL